MALEGFRALQFVPPSVPSSLNMYVSSPSYNHARASRESLTRVSNCCELIFWGRVRPNLSDKISRESCAVKVPSQVEKEKRENANFRSKKLPV